MGRDERAKTLKHVNGMSHEMPSLPIEVTMDASDFESMQDAIEARDQAMRQAEIAAHEAKLAALKAHDACEVIVARIRRKYPTFSSRVNYTPDEPRHTWVPVTAPAHTDGIKHQ